MEEEEEENVVDNQSHPVQIQPFGSYKKEIEAVVIEAEQGASENGAVGALAGPPIFRKPQIDSNIYNYNTNYNWVRFDRIFIFNIDKLIFLFHLFQIYQRQFKYDYPVPSVYVPLYNRQRQHEVLYYPWYGK